MSPDDFVMGVIEAFGGTTKGRTLLQKRSFFVAMLSGLDPGLRFDAHYYGPYSATVDNTLAQLVSIGFIAESNTGFGVAQSGFEVRRYDYCLTPDGKRIIERLKSTAEYARIKNAADRILAAGDPNYVELSIAAKALYILQKEGGPTSTEEIIRKAQGFDWTIGANQLEKAVHFLEALQLVRHQGAKA